MYQCTLSVNTRRLPTHSYPPHAAGAATCTSLCRTCLNPADCTRAASNSSKLTSNTAAVLLPCRQCLLLLSTAMELGAQIKLVATCGTVAAFLDGFTILLDAMLLWKMACDPTDTVCMAVSKYAFVFALGCGHHGIISYMVAQRANSIMPLLNPVSSGAVQL